MPFIFFIMEKAYWVVRHHTEREIFCSRGLLQRGVWTCAAVNCRASGRWQPLILAITCQDGPRQSSATAAGQHPWTIADSDCYYAPVEAATGKIRAAPSQSRPRGGPGLSEIRRQRDQHRGKLLHPNEKQTVNYFGLRYQSQRRSPTSCSAISRTEAPFTASTASPGRSMGWLAARPVSETCGAVCVFQP